MQRRRLDGNFMTGKPKRSLRRIYAVFSGETSDAKKNTSCTSRPVHPEPLESEGGCGIRTANHTVQTGIRLIQTMVGLKFPKKFAGMDETVQKDVYICWKRNGKRTVVDEGFFSGKKHMTELPVQRMRMLNDRI